MRAFSGKIISNAYVYVISFNPILDDLFLHPIIDRGECPPIELNPKTKSGEDLQQK